MTCHYGMFASSSTKLEEPSRSRANADWLQGQTVMSCFVAFSSQIAGFLETERQGRRAPTALASLASQDLRSDCQPGSRCTSGLDCSARLYWRNVVL